MKALRRRKRFLAGHAYGRNVFFFDVPIHSPVSAASLAERGANLGFCPPPCGADVAWEEYIERRPWYSEEAFLAALATAPIDKVLLGTGLRFRTDLAAFGGPGLGYSYDLLVRASTSRPGSLPTIPDLRKIAVALLQYSWVPPLPPQKISYYIDCHWCGTSKPEGEHFSKMDFDYCSPKCISKHRQVDFDPDRHERA